MRVVAFVMAAGLLLTGCGSVEPKEPKPTTAPSATATEPSMPPGAKKNTVGGAEAFVRYYVELLNFASVSGNTTRLSDLSDPTCEGCSAYVELYRKTYDAGGYYKDSEWKLTDVHDEVQNGQPVVFADVHIPAGTYRTKSGVPERRGTAEDSKLTFVPILKGHSWLVKVFGLQSGTK